VTQERASRREPLDQHDVVLVVDDDLGYRQIVRWALEDAGLAVETAADAREALQTAARRRPALAIVDVGLPEGEADGIALASELRRLCDAHLPIITINADGRAEEKAQQMRAEAWLQKPFDITDLLGAVRRLLDARRK
jgi:DNA-binding response OmpR family regulator